MFYPEFEFCTDNGAMIALAGALRLGAGVVGASLLANDLARAGTVGASSFANVPQPDRTYAFTVKPRWDLSTGVL